MPTISMVTLLNDRVEWQFDHELKFRESYDYFKGGREQTLPGKCDMVARKFVYNTQIKNQNQPVCEHCVLNMVALQDSIIPR